MTYDQLKLENQLCFPVYAASRLITREYQPYLDELEITYPQYLVMMILWENDGMPVNDIAKKLILNTNTITPLLKRMEKQGLVSRERSSNDERKVIIKLTQKGNELKDKAIKIPERLASQLLEGPMSVEELIRLKDDLGKIINHLSKK
nr:MarR family transcriptional regulator [uncultured Carboxylicivirga sp.]